MIILLISAIMIIPAPVIITISVITTKSIFGNCKLAKLANSDFYVIVP